MTARERDHEAVDTAWRIHAALSEWTGRVENKASFASAIESVLLFGIINLGTNDRQLADRSDGWVRMLYWAGAGLTVLSLLLVLYAVYPRLRSRKVESEAKDNFIFFGHLIHWKADDLELALGNRDILPVLSRQLVVMSEIAWLKHRLLRASMTGAVIASAMIGLAAFLND